MKSSLLLAVFVAGLVVAAPGWLAAEESVTRVTYVTGSSVYLDVGRSSGLAIGERLSLTREGTEVATIEVVEVSGSRAVAKIVEQTLPPAIGDSAGFSSATEPEPLPLPAQATKAKKPEKKRRGSSGITGRVGLRFISLQDDINPDGGYSQPALDLRVDGTRMDSTPWGFEIDVRARQTYRNESGAADTSATRAYKFLVSRGRANDGWRFSLGRQFSPHLAAISIFDGFAADYGSERWGTGIVSGTQPDPLDYGFSSEITEHGFYFRFNGSPTATKQWNVVTGAVGSYLSGEINREFIYVLGRFRTRRFWGYALQEIDFNRDWKVDEAGEASIQPTSSFLTMSLRATDQVTLRAGYDNRRNVRLARDRITPATDFDDNFRQGAWVGVTARTREHFVAGFDSRFNNGGVAGSSTTYGASVGAQRLTSSNVRIFTRLARYENDQIEGILVQLDAGIDLTRNVRLQAQAGRREDTNLVTIPAESQLNWYGLSVDAFLGKRWYGTVEIERTDGVTDRVTQLYLTATYRF